MSNDLTVLEAVNIACDELGLPEVTTLFGASTGLQARQLRALINRDGIDLYQSKADGWTCLQGEHIINVETPTTLVGTVTINSTTCTVTSTAGLSTAYAVDGVGQPAAQRIAEVVNATTLRLEMESTASGVATDLIFAKDTYDLPSDFSSYTANTWWDRTNHWMLMGPQSPQMDQWQRSGIVTTGPRLRWRQIGHRPTVWRIWPPPTSQSVPDALVFEFVSDGWVETAAGAFQKRFTADDDLTLLDNDALILGCKWRFFQIKGFTTEALQMQAEYTDYCNRLRARDGGIPDLSMTRSRYPYLISSANVQDGNFPGNT